MKIIYYDNECYISTIKNKPTKLKLTIYNKNDDSICIELDEWELNEKLGLMFDACFCYFWCKIWYWYFWF